MNETNESTAAFQDALTGNSHELVTALTRRCEILTATNASLIDDITALKKKLRRKTKYQRRTQC